MTKFRIIFLHFYYILKRHLSGFFSNFSSSILVYQNRPLNSFKTNIFRYQKNFFFKPIPKNAEFTFLGTKINFAFFKKNFPLLVWL